MDISSITLVTFSSILALGSSIAIILVNYQRWCRCFIRRNANDSVTSINPVAEEDIPVSVKVWS